MKNTLKYTSSVLVLVLLSATVYGGSSTPAGAPKKRTWAEWASQKAAANNVFASRDARAAAAAQLKLGTAEMQETKAAADLKYQQDRTAQQARDVQAAAAAQARLAELNKSIALQKEAARLERQNRSNIRLGIPSAAPAQAAEPIAAPVTAKSAAPAPAQPAEPIAAAVTAKSAAPTAAPAPARLKKISANEVQKKVDPAFYAYLENGKGSRADAINALAKQGIKVDDDEIKKYQKEYLAAKPNNGMVNLPIAAAG